MIYFRSKSWELNFPGPQLLRVKSTENLRSDILIIPLPDASLGNHSTPKKTNQQILLIMKIIGAGETAQQSSTLPILPKDLSSVFSTHIRWLTAICNSSSREF